LPPCVDLENRILNLGTKIGAFFDLDGTVIVPPSLEFRFVMHLARKGDLRPSAIARWLGVFLREGLGSILKDAAIDHNKGYLKGVRQSSAEDWAVEHAASLEFLPDAIRQIAWHREQGHRIFFVSGTLAPLARALAPYLTDSAETCFAAIELMEIEGRWTGHIAGQAVCGPAKAREVERLAGLNDVDLSFSYAYGNSLADRWMLASVGNGVAVNPAITLATLARTSGWRIVRWRREEPYARQTSACPSSPVFSRRTSSWK
jgi:HAD superfamily hydrolase (TIGR01490 family)